MTQPVIYQVISHEDAWTVSCEGVVLACFLQRDRAVRFADQQAQYRFTRGGVPAVVRWCEASECVDITLFGENDPAAQALAWIRHVSAMRGLREPSESSMPPTRLRA